MTLTALLHGLHRMARWFARTSVREVGDVRRAKLLTLKEPVYVTLLCFIWTVTAAAFLWFLSSEDWGLLWIAAECILCWLRLQLSREIEFAERWHRRLPAASVFVVHSVWFGVNAVGAFVVVSQLDIRLLLIGTIIPIGFCGYVASRWRAFPRYAAVFIFVLCAGLFLGLSGSPFSGASDVAWLVPSGALAFHLLTRANHSALLASLNIRQEYKRLSLHDPLTGLPNRLMLVKQLQRLFELQEAKAQQSSFAVMYLDLDAFKAVNDRLGHAAGDLLLKSVGRRLRDAVRMQDMVCRVGGDEFVVLLPAIYGSELTRVSNRILQLISQPHELDDNGTVTVEASIGIAIAPAHAKNADDILSAADTALYGAKRAGKGQWLVFRSAGA